VPERPSFAQFRTAEQEISKDFQKSVRVPRGYRSYL
jgi:hypothetical protein